MQDGPPQTRRMILEAGALVILHPDGPAGGFPMLVAVDQVLDGQHWFLGCCSPIVRGEQLTVESPVVNDARYVTRATVTASSASTFALELEPLWQRVQQRAFVRISAHDLQVRIVRCLSSPEDREQTDADLDDAMHRLVDISAGGIRFESSTDYQAGEDVICHFELPGSLCFVLSGRIVRAPERHPAQPGKPSVAVEFVGLDETHRSQLLRWVYREQVRRHRLRDREQEKAQKLASRRGASRR